MSAACKRRTGARSSRRVAACLLLIGLGLPHVALAQDGSPTAAVPRNVSPPPPMQTADFKGETASPPARAMANWIVQSGDNQGLPFVIIDKANAKVFAFAASGTLKAAAPALLGLAFGDDSAAGIGKRKLATIGAGERTTAAGRFMASLGRDFVQDILWIDYESGLSLHRVITGNPKDRRFERLASPSPLDNRVSYGCVNVPIDFYDQVVMPLFKGTVGVVYILPETVALEKVFAIGNRQGDIAP